MSVLVPLAPDRDAALARRNPVAKLAAAFVVTAGLLVTLDPVTPAVLLGLEVLGLSILAIKPAPETARALEAETREKLFRAWTEPELMKQWFTPRPWTTPVIETDVRPGGPSSLRFSQGLRTPRYLYAEHATRERELYDLRSDPEELTNLGAAVILNGESYEDAAAQWLEDNGL